MRIYLASSWRNPSQPAAVDRLREIGHEVYDFRNPKAENYGFSWSVIDRGWKQWTAMQYRRFLDHRAAVDGFALDWGAMQWADTGVLLLPCGRSAHLEAGYFVGAGKPLYIILAEENEPELMYKMATAMFLSMDEFIEATRKGW